MIGWLAIAAFCIGNDCGFYADTKTPFGSQEECMVRAKQMDEYLRQNGISSTIFGCVPIKFRQT